MDFETYINGLNEFFFFKEFTYSSNKIRRTDGQEVEVADSIIYLDELSFVFQLKERIEPKDTTPEKERKWFNNKVLKLATKQIRDTISYIQEAENMVLSNNRGHSIEICPTSLSSLHKIVIHQSSRLLPESQQNTKYHVSGTAGVIHIFQARDYQGVIQYLVTPTELSEYLNFRSELIANYGEQINALPEYALLGQYLSGNYEGSPSSEFADFVWALKDNPEKWDMSGIIKDFTKKITHTTGDMDYYQIIKEIAKLMRNDLYEFKRRFMLSWKAAKENNRPPPYRMYIPKTECSFLFLPLTKEEESLRKNALIHLTLANKYDLQSYKAIGISFISTDDEWQNVEWCYVEAIWEQNDEMDNMLEMNYPFRKVKEQYQDRYTFN